MGTSCTLNLYIYIFPPDVTMAAKFSISDNDSESSEEVEGGRLDLAASGGEGGGGGGHLHDRHALTLPELRLTSR